jgi:hypothetical protein
LAAEDLVEVRDEEARKEDLIRREDLAKKEEAIGEEL